MDFEPARLGRCGRGQLADLVEDIAELASGVDDLGRGVQQAGDVDPQLVAGAAAEQLEGGGVPRRRGQRPPVRVGLDRCRNVIGRRPDDTMQVLPRRGTRSGS